MVQEKLNNTSIINKDLILLNVEVQDREEILEEMANNFVRHGFASYEYPNAIIERENEFPTGIPTASIGIAIPHADAKHVKEASISMATLKNPVIFHNMGTNEEMPVEIIFMLAIKDPNDQLNMLQKLMSVFQNKESLARIKDVASKEEVLKMIEFLLHDTVHIEY